MNIDNLNKLIDILSDEPGYPGLPKFNMPSYLTANLPDIDPANAGHCHACVMGLAALLGKRDGYYEGGFAPSELAKKYLGLDEATERMIAYPKMFGGYEWGETGDITKAHAVRMLTKLRDTGEVDWNGTAVAEIEEASDYA